MNRRVIGLLAILALGAGLRFHALDRPSLWDDEMSTLKGISTPTFSAEVDYMKAHDPHPPLYFFQLRLWRAALGSSLAALRANSAFWGTLSVLAIYGLGSFFAGPALGLGAAAFLALSPIHIAYSQELRPYALSILFAILGFWAMGRLLRDQRGALVLAVVWIGQLFTHYWGAFVCAAAGTYGLVHAPTNAVRRRILITGAIAIALFALWWPVLHGQLGTINGFSFWMPGASITNLGKTFVAFSGFYFKVASAVFRAPGPTALLALLGGILIGALAIGSWKGPPPLRYWLGLGLLMPWALSYWKWGIFLWYRYTLHMYPAFVLLVVVGALSFSQRWLRALTLTLVLAAQALATAHYMAGWQKANPKDAVRYAESLATADTVVVRPYYFRELFDFYDQGRLRVVDQHTLDSPAKRETLRGHPIIVLAFDTPNDPVGEALLRQFTVVSRRDFPAFGHLGITVYQLR